MLLFDSYPPEAFKDGLWAKGLKDRLDPDYLRELLGSPAPIFIAPGWKCKVRHWTTPLVQWVQFEREEWPSGPCFWRCKPAVLASPSSPSALYAGFYIERGLPPGAATPAEVERGQVMADDDENWDWNRFYPRLSTETGLGEIMLKFPAQRRCIWVWDSTAKCGKPFPFQGRPALADVQKHITGIARDHWIDLVVGVEYSLSECVHLQDGLVKELVKVDADGLAAGPLKLACELCQLIRPHQGEGHEISDSPTS
ncbi:MAG: hypothetical protein ABSF45_30475 [Terriglobia bacterium]